MQQITVIDPCSDKRWDTFVYEHPLGLIYHTSTWKVILEKNFKHIKAHYIALIDTDTDEIKAALPLCYVSSWITGDRLVSLPFATICPPLVSSSEEFKILFDAAIDLKERLGGKYIEIKGILEKEFVNNNNQIALQNNYKAHYLMVNKEPKELIRQFKRTVRQCIRQAEEANLEVYEEKGEDGFNEFYNLYLKTRKRQLLPPQPRQFIYTLWQELYSRGYSNLLIARYKGKTIGGIIILKFKDRVSAEFLVSDGNYFHLKVNHLLMWSAIKKVQKEGYYIFDLGRTATYNKGLMNFKKGWGTTEIDLIQAIYPAHEGHSLNEKHSVKRKFLRVLCRISPVLAYRALGKFVYQHHG